MFRRPVIFAALCVLLCLLPTPSVAAVKAYSPPASYHTFSSMVQELQNLQASHPDLVKMESIGKTWEGRDIWAVKISDDVATNDSSEPDVLIFGGIHAREVMGVEVPMYVLNYLIDKYGTDEACTKYVNTREIWFVPMINPDGHDFVVVQDYDWRKNRRPTTGGNIGVDLNRNWGYMWGTDSATSSNPASETYHGPYPFSESEIIALRDLSLRQRFATSLSFHSFGEYVLFPWGYTNTHCPDYTELSTMANVMAGMNGYTAMPAYQLYVTHGDSDDWLYGTTSTKAFTIELDDRFYPPESWISATCILNRGPVLYLIGYPHSQIADAGIFGLTSPANGTAIGSDSVLNVNARVMNYGDSEIDIPVELAITSPEGYTDINSTTAHLRAGQVKDVVFSWSPPFPGTENYTLSVRTNLTGDEYSRNDWKNSSFKIKAKYGVTLNATNLSRSAFPGESVNYSFQMFSSSNREDDVLLAKSGNHAEWVSAPSSIHILPGGQTEINISVSIPRNASAGGTVVVSIGAQSSTGEGSPALLTTRTTILDATPTADAGNDVLANISESLEFDGSGSSTPIGTILRYAWDFGDGNGSEGTKAAHSYEKAGDYTVKLMVFNDLDLQGSDYVNVTVQQLFRINLSAESTDIAIAPDESVKVNLSVVNSGDGLDAVNVDLSALMWNASLDTRYTSLNAGQKKIMTLNVTAPVDALANAKAQFQITTTSAGNPLAKSSVTITATVKETRNLVSNISESAMTANAGDNATFWLTFNNSGNVKEKLQMSAEDLPKDWKILFSSDVATVGPRNTTKIKANVSVPSDALAGRYVFAVNGQHLEVVINPKYGFEASAKQSATAVVSGERVLFEVVVKNAGNAPDTYFLNFTELPAGWSIENSDAFIVPPGENYTKSTGVRIPSGTTSGKYNLTFQICSANSTNIIKNLTFQIEVSETPVDNEIASESEGFFSSPIFIMSAIAILIILSAAGIGIYYVSWTIRKSDSMSRPSAGRSGTPPTNIAGAPPANMPSTSVMPPPEKYQPEGHPPGPPQSQTILVQDTYVPCFQCRMPLNKGESGRLCPSCGAVFHEYCAHATERCHRCGWLF
ncbi:MAG: M14 family zinc carboxypeptidase [Thermoplasmata archaeon]